MGPGWAGGSTRRSVSGAGFPGPGSGGWLEADGVAEGFEPGDQAAGFAFGVQPGGEVVLAEFVAGPAGGQYMPDDECDTRSHMLRVNLADWRASMT